VGGAGDYGASPPSYQSMNCIGGPGGGVPGSSSSGLRVRVRVESGRGPGRLALSPQQQSVSSAEMTIGHTF